MHDLYESKDAVYIVTDLAAGGELFQQLLDKKNYTEKDASNVVRQMLEGLAYLHDHDVRPERAQIRLYLRISFRLCTEISSQKT